jgi:hypothetical protein
MPPSDNCGHDNAITAATATGVAQPVCPCIYRAYQGGDNVNNAPEPAAAPAIIIHQLRAKHSRAAR